MAAFGTLAPAPYQGQQLSGRVDYRFNDKHTLFARYSHDGNTNSGPFGTPVPPSNFVSNKNYVDQQTGRHHEHPERHAGERLPFLAHVLEEPERARGVQRRPQRELHRRRAARRSTTSIP